MNKEEIIQQVKELLEDNEILAIEVRQGVLNENTECNFLIVAFKPLPKLTPEMLQTFQDALHSKEAS